MLCQTFFLPQEICSLDPRAEGYSSYISSTTFFAPFLTFRPWSSFTFQDPLNLWPLVARSLPSRNTKLF